ncbi:hypothetical protein [Desulfosporosinus sp. SB140]|uniref:hypothetical protein n=1 Tax=Desulfosporosinus paludis TaxID=3115649 RepID=UPI00388D31C8
MSHLFGRRSSCQTRALILDKSGQGTRPTRRPCRMAGGKRPVSRPAYESGLKPSLATTRAKTSRRVSTPSGSEKTEGGCVTLVRLALVVLLLYVLEGAEYWL